MDACAHPFFEDLRNPNTTLPNQRPLPTLFDFTISELSSARHIPWVQLLPPQLLAQCPSLRQQAESTSLSSNETLERDKDEPATPEQLTTLETTTEDEPKGSSSSSSSDPSATNEQKVVEVPSSSTTFDDSNLIDTNK